MPPALRAGHSEASSADLLQDRAAIGGTVFALVMLMANWGNSRHFWMAGAICALFALFAMKLSHITFLAGNTESANACHVAGNTLFGLSIMAISDFSPASLFVIPVAVLLFEGFGEGDTRPLAWGMLATLTAIPLAAGPSVVAPLAAGAAGLIAHWISDARTEQSRESRTDLKSAGYLLRQTNEKLKHANEMIEVRSTELRVVHEKLSATQSKLAQSEELASVGQLATGIAQEISEPLSAILEYAQEMDVRIGEDSGLRTIIRDSLRCKALTEELVTFSENSKLAVQRIDVNAMLRGAAHRLDSRARAQRTTVNLELSNDPPALVGNVAQLQQAVVDMANDALDALSNGGQVTLRSRRTWDGNVSLEVFDNGPAKRSRLGSPRLHEIARQHGALIEVKNTVGKGTSMTMNFPSQRRGAAV
jgi:signal transduction histidine kinase